jgi:hypothetical protein
MNPPALKPLRLSAHKRRNAPAFRASAVLLADMIFIRV